MDWPRPNLDAFQACSLESGNQSGRAKRLPRLRRGPGKSWSLKSFPKRFGQDEHAPRTKDPEHFRGELLSVLDVCDHAERPGLVRQFGPKRERFGGPRDERYSLLLGGGGPRPALPLQQNLRQGVDGEDPGTGEAGQPPGRPTKARPDIHDHIVRPRTHGLDNSLYHLRRPRPVFTVAGESLPEVGLSHIGHSERIPMKAVRANRLGGQGAGNERAVTVDATSQAPDEVARLPIATTSGEFDLRAFELASGHVYLALVKGEIGDGPPVLTRLHSECLTGDALDSLRCDCGIQLRMGLRTIAAEGRGVLLYATGQEGRGIGLVNKLRTYMLQDEGADTVEANALLGLPIDRRDYRDSAAVLSMLGVKSVRLLTNNPSKAAGLRAGGLAVAEIVPIVSSPHLRNIEYLRTKRRRLGHVSPPVPAHNGVTEIADIDSVLGNGGARADRPRVVLKFAQTLDGRIASRGGDSKWISGEAERTLSHALRAGCDAVMVGVGTVATDNPRLTVRLVPGASPLRVVLDSTLRIPDNANVLDASAGTIILTTNRATLARTESLLQRGVAVRVIEEGRDGVDLKAALRTLREEGIESLLVEGGSRVITSFLAARVVDRVVVAIAPSILGSGTEAVGNLQFRTLRDALRLEDPSTYRVGEDLVVAGDL